LTTHQSKIKLLKVAHNKKHTKLLKLMVNINIIKYTITDKNQTYIYMQNNNFTKIMWFSKTSETFFINYEELKKLCNTKKCMFILSTNNGVITNIEAANKKVGGKLLAGIFY